MNLEVETWNMNYTKNMTNQLWRTKMKQNVHNVERVIRILVGIGLISLVFVGPQTPWGWIGLVPLITGLIGWCLPYAILGISTCKVHSPE